MRTFVCVFCMVLTTLFPDARVEDGLGILFIIALSAAFCMAITQDFLEILNKINSGKGD